MPLVSELLKRLFQAIQITSHVGLFMLRQKNREELFSKEAVVEEEIFKWNVYHATCGA